MHSIVLVSSLPHTCCGVVAVLCRGCRVGRLQGLASRCMLGAAVHWDLDVQAYGKRPELAS